MRDLADLDAIAEGNGRLGLPGGRGSDEEQDE
jgi:hypothetical protein